MKKGLGKGLSALFAETEEDYGKSLLFEEEAPAATDRSVVEVEIEKIFANPNQPRKSFDEGALRELADSIAKHGVIMPIIVNKSGDRYMIIAGERRASSRGFPACRSSSSSTTSGRSRRSP